MKWEALKPPCLYLEIASEAEHHIEIKVALSLTNVVQLWRVNFFRRLCERSTIAGKKWTRCRRLVAPFSAALRFRCARARVCVVFFFSVSVNFGFNAAPSRRTVRNFNAWARNRGADVVVMDNPSSVITQVSRDEEASKAAAERGESFYFCPTQEKRKKRTLAKSEWQQPRKFALLSVVVAPRTSEWFNLHSGAQCRTFITLSRRGLTVLQRLLWSRPFGLWWKWRKWRQRARRAWVALISAWKRFIQ